MADPTKPFGKRVQIWSPGRQNQWLRATAPQQAPKGGDVPRVSVQDEVLHAAQEAAASVSQVPCDLCHPGLVRLTRDAGDLHRAGLEFHDEEDDVADQSAKGQHLDGEEVGGREAIPMSGQERLPGRFRCRALVRARCRGL